MARKSKSRKSKGVKRNKKHKRWGKVSAHKRRVNPKRSKSGKRRRNPIGSLKSALSKNFLINSVVLALGLITGIKATKFILQIPGVASINRFVGVIHVLLGGILVAKMKNDKLKSLGAGIAAAGAYDLIAKNVSPLGLPTLLGMDSDVAGDDYMGETYIPGGTEVLGETYIPGNTEILGDDLASDAYYNIG